MYSKNTNNNSVFDRLVLREDSNGQLNVVGLIEIEVKSLLQLRKTIESAQLNRHIGSTSFNKASSRSHAVIQFKVASVDATPNGSNGQMSSRQSGQVKSKVNSGGCVIVNGTTKKFQLHSTNSSEGKFFRIIFIDLAGSERGIDAQNNQHDNRKEGAEINQSLLAVS